MPKKRAKKGGAAANRAASTAVADYLESLEQHKPKRGRKRTEQSIRRELREAEAKLAAATPGRRPGWAQRKVELEGELRSLASRDDHAEKERAFVGAAARYSEQKGISYAAWRELGVPADVLGKAGIRRGS